jgi:hypothetical protein
MQAFKAREYRQRAKDCLELAKGAEDPFSKEAMLELAREFNKAAEQLDAPPPMQLADRRSRTARAA